MMADRSSAKTVFVTPFEVVGDGVAIAEAFYSERYAVRKAQFEIVDQFGAEGYRPSHDGGIRSLFFKELPEGWREVGSHMGNIEALPRKTTKVGKAAQKRLDEAPRMQIEEKLAALLGWDIGMVCTGRSLYHATATKLAFPRVRYLVSIPCHDADEWTPPASLKELTQSEYRLAFHEHNAEAERQRIAATSGKEAA